MMIHITLPPDSNLSLKADWLSGWGIAAIEAVILRMIFHLMFWQGFQEAQVFVLQI